MSLQALDKTTRQKLSIWGRYAAEPFGIRYWKHSYNSILGAVEVSWLVGEWRASNRKADSIVCSYEEATAIMAYLQSCRRQRPRPKTVRDRVDDWKKIIAKGDAEQYYVILRDFRPFLEIWEKGLSVGSLKECLRFESTDEAREYYRMFLTLLEVHRKEKLKSVASPHI